MADLHICVACGSGFVTPVREREWDYFRTAATLRCGECGHKRTDVFDRLSWTDFRERLDADAFAMRRWLDEHARTG